MKKILLKLLRLVGYEILRVDKKKLSNDLLISNSNTKTNLDDLSEIIVPYEDILSIPRYRKFTTELLGKPFYLADSASYYYSFKEIFTDGIYEFKTDKTQPLIIDCGTNVGTSLVYFKNLYPNAKIIGFEADPNVFEICKSNVFTFGYHDIKLINKAIWNEEKEIDFMVEGADGGRIDSIIKESKTVKVKTVKLSNFITTEVDFLKIDIEGAESTVIPEIKDQLHLVKNLFLEYHSLVNNPQNLSEILRTIEKAGFRHHIITQMGTNKPFINHLNHLGMDNQLNIYCYRI